MPISRTTTAGGTGYADIRVGEVQVHQIQLAATLTADADGYLPVGLPVKVDGTAVAATQATYAYVGPEPVKKAATGVTPGNVILMGVLNRDMIEANLGRVLITEEATPPAGIRLI